MNIFFGNRIQRGRRALLVRIFNGVQQAESQNGHGAVATTELAFERRKDVIKSGVFYGLPVAPILETRADAHCTTCKADFFSPRLWHVRHCIAQGTAKGKWNTHTHTHTEGCQLLRFAYRFMLPSKRCYAHANWATVNNTHTHTKINLHSLSRCKTINGLHWAAEVCCTKRVSSHVLD